MLILRPVILHMVLHKVSHFQCELWPIKKCRLHGPFRASREAPNLRMCLQYLRGCSCLSKSGFIAKPSWKRASRRHCFQWSLAIDLQFRLSYKLSVLASAEPDPATLQRTCNGTTKNPYPSVDNSKLVFRVQYHPAEIVLGTFCVGIRLLKCAFILPLMD